MGNVHLFQKQQLVLNQIKLLLAFKISTFGPHYERQRVIHELCDTFIPRNACISYLGHATTITSSGRRHLPFSSLGYSPIFHIQRNR